MLRTLLLAAAIWSGGQHFCVDRPTSPVVKWEGWFSFSGLRDKNRKIVVQNCFPVRKTTDLKRLEQEREMFCKVAGTKTGRPDLCFTTGQHTYEKCRDIIAQNTRWYKYYGEVINLQRESHVRE